MCLIRLEVLFCTVPISCTFDVSDAPPEESVTLLVGDTQYKSSVSILYDNIVDTRALQLL